MGRVTTELTGEPEPWLERLDPGRRGGTKLDNGSSSSVDEGCSSSSVSVATGATVFGFTFAALKEEVIVDVWVITLVD